MVLNADTLTVAQMQSTARELHNSETAFVLPPEGRDHHLRICFFTPIKEVPSCGHATLAVHHLRAQILGVGPGRYWHRIGIGRLPVDITIDGSDFLVTMAQQRPQVSTPITGELLLSVITALSLSKSDLEPDLPVPWTDTGHSRILVPIQSRDRLCDLSPDNQALLGVNNHIPNAGSVPFALMVSIPV